MLFKDSVPEVRKLSVKERLGIRPGPMGITPSSVVHQPRSSTPQQLANNGIVKEELEKVIVFMLYVLFVSLFYDVNVHQSVVIQLVQ